MQTDSNAHRISDPNFIKRVYASFEKQMFMKFIGASLQKVEAGYCEIALPFNTDLTQQHGFIHAGVVSTMADNAAGYSAFSLMKSTSSILTVEFKINLLAPAKGESLVAKASVLKHGQMLTICRSDVFVCEGNTIRLCAAAQVTLIELLERRDN
jgi:uncharacterized protein (TIGR00369 family)